VVFAVSEVLSLVSEDCWWRRSEWYLKFKCGIGRLVADLMLRLLIKISVIGKVSWYNGAGGRLYG